MIIVPGLMGIATYAPPLDKYGNSAKGVQFATEISDRYGLHFFQIGQGTKGNLRERKSDYDINSINLNKYCATGDLDDIKRLIMQGVDFELGDYDGRTPLHLAASEGHIEIVEYLIDAGLTNINPIDRWGNTPYDDAVRGGYENLAKY